MVLAQSDHFLEVKNNLFTTPQRRHSTARRSQLIAPTCAGVLMLLPPTSKQQRLALLNSKPCRRWFRLLFSQKVGLCSQIVFQSRLSLKEIGY